MPIFIINFDFLFAAFNRWILVSSRFQNTRVHEQKLDQKYILLTRIIYCIRSQSLSPHRNNSDFVRFVTLLGNQQFYIRFLLTIIEK